MLMRAFNSKGQEMRIEDGTLRDLVVPHALSQLFLSDDEMYATTISGIGFLADKRGDSDARSEDFGHIADILAREKIKHWQVSTEYLGICAQRLVAIEHISMIKDHDEVLSIYPLGAGGAVEIPYDPNDAAKMKYIKSLKDQFKATSREDDPVIHDVFPHAHLSNSVSEWIVRPKHITHCDDFTAAHVIGSFCLKFNSSVIPVPCITPPQREWDKDAELQKRYKGDMNLWMQDFAFKKGRPFLNKILAINPKIKFTPLLLGIDGLI